MFFQKDVLKFCNIHRKPHVLESFPENVQGLNITKFSRKSFFIEHLPWLLLIIINYIFLFSEKSDICSFADDSTLFCCGDNLSVVLKCVDLDVNPGKF